MSGLGSKPGTWVFDEFSGACNALTGVTTEQLPPERQEAKPLCAKAMWPDAVAARSFRNTVQYVVGGCSKQFLASTCIFRESSYSLLRP